jgi:hypothetical protein
LIFSLFLDLWIATKISSDVIDVLGTETSFGTSSLLSRDILRPVELDLFVLAGCLDISSLREYFSMGENVVPKDIKVESFWENDPILSFVGVDEQKPFWESCHNGTLGR